MKKLIVTVLALSIPLSTLAASLPSKWSVPYLSGPRTNASTVYYQPFGDGTSGSAATEVVHLGITSATGTVSNLHVKISPSSPGTGKSYAFTFRANQVDTALTCTIADAATTCSDTTHSVSINAGDKVSISQTPSGTPTQATTSMLVDFTPTTQGETVLTGNAGVTLSLSNYQYYPLVGAVSNTSSLITRRIVIPTSGTLKNLYVWQPTASGVGNSRTFTIFQNGATTSLAVTFADTDSGIKSDTVDTLSIAAGDTLMMQVATSSTPASTRGAWGVTFVPTTNGDFIFPTINNSSLSTSLKQYVGIEEGGGSGASTNEVTMQSIGWSDYTIKAAYALVNNPPVGAGNGWTFNLRVNGADASSPMTNTIFNTATASNASGSFTPADFDLLDTSSQPSGSPTGAVLSYSYLASANVASTDTYANPIAIILDGLTVLGSMFINQ